jgi:hypothetical protein
MSLMGDLVCHLEELVDSLLLSDWYFVAIVATLSGRRGTSRGGGDAGPVYLESKW